MIPQGVALRDAVKPPQGYETEQAKSISQQAVNKVVEAKKVKESEEKKNTMPLEKAVQKSNETAAVMSSQVRFEVDSQTKDVIVKVINKETGDVIREIPSEEMVRLASRVKELRGLIFNEEG